MSNENVKSIILDADPGMGVAYADIDDNLALLFALGGHEINIELVSIVEGNVPAVLGVQSMEATLAYLRADIPLSIGSRTPLFRQPFYAGMDVLRRMSGPIDYRGSIELDDAASVSGFAVGDMASLIERAERPVTLVAIGPLTNVAVLLHQRPDLHSKIDSIVIMGGAINREGNITPFAEFNIWIDPDAASMVFDCPVPKVLVGLDVTTKVVIEPEEFEPVLAKLSNDRFATYVRESVAGWVQVTQRLGGVLGFNPHDPIALAYLIEPTLFRTEQMSVSVDTRTGRTIGKPDQDGTTRVCLDLDGERFRRLFFERLGRVPLKG